MTLKIGISACLTGEKVRYDGRHKQQSYIIQQLSTVAELVPVCPEVGSGLGVPRPAVQLVSINDDIFMRGVVDSELDVTAAVTRWIEENRALFDTLDAFVLKARSPSCGSGSVPVFDQAGNRLHFGSGLFAAELQQRYPEKLLVDEDALATDAQLSAFIARLKNV